MANNELLRMWFDSVDVDRSGSINCEELQVFAFLLMFLIPLGHDLRLLFSCLRVGILEQGLESGISLP